MGDVRDVSGELAHAERFLVRFPRKLCLGRALEKPPRGAHLVVEFGKHRVFDSHRRRICRPTGQFKVSEGLTKNQEPKTDQLLNLSIVYTVLLLEPE
jgi:hypothetical protein